MCQYTNWGSLSVLHITTCMHCMCCLLSTTSPGSHMSYISSQPLDHSRVFPPTLAKPLVQLARAVIPASKQSAAELLILQVCTAPQRCLCSNALSAGVVAGVTPEQREPLHTCAKLGGKSKHHTANGICGSALGSIRTAYKAVCLLLQLRCATQAHTRCCCAGHCFMRMCALMTSSTSSSCEATTGALCSIWRFTDRLS